MINETDIIMVLNSTEVGGIIKDLLYYNKFTGGMMIVIFVMLIIIFAALILIYIKLKNERGF